MQSALDNFKIAADMVGKSTKLYEETLKNVEKRINSGTFEGKKELQNVIEKMKSGVAKQDQSAINKCMEEVSKILNK